MLAECPQIAQGSVYPGQGLSQPSAWPMLKPLIELGSFLLQRNPSKVPHILVGRCQRRKLGRRLFEKRAHPLRRFADCSVL